jgi:hypothetical protein
MKDYFIGFRSGERLAIQVTDGVQFVKDIVAGVNQNTAATVQWHVQPGLILNVSEITYIVPRTATVESKT